MLLENPQRKEGRGGGVHERMDFYSIHAFLHLASVLLQAVDLLLGEALLEEALVEGVNLGLALVEALEDGALVAGAALGGAGAADLAGGGLGLLGHDVVCWLKEGLAT